ncbi:MAG: hypothetical protein CMD58_02640 [Gammaproteobacteria bacterium]|jgi:hypothetical protein|nr:hypothetical protein [Gammaproteobacteria bacterium]
MEFIILVVVILALIGSLSLAIPSKKSRKISKVRLDSKLLGCKISSTLYGSNNFKNNNSLPVSYQIKNTIFLKEGHFIRDKNSFMLYSPVQLKYSDNLKKIDIMLNNMPKSLDEIIFSQVSISFLWKETEGINDLKIILKNLEEFKKL